MSKLLSVINKKSTESSFLFYLFLIIPFIYIQNDGNKTLAFRLLAFYGISLTLLLIPNNRIQLVKNFKEYNNQIRYIFITLLILMGLSTIFSDSILFTKIVGTAPSFLGLFTWLSMGVFALFNASSLSKTLFSYRTVQIVLGIVVVSLIINKLYVINGFRIPGLLLQSTTFAMYSVCSIVVTLTVILSKKIKLSTQRKVISIVALLIFNTTVMISHSRVSYISLIIIYILFAIKMLYRNYKISILFTFIAILIPLSMFINKNYFYRVSSQSVSYGTSYRLDLYKTSISDIAKNNTVIGNGPSTLPDAINDQNKAPEDIQSTLLSGYIFSSTHNLFIDLAYYFGLIAGLIVVLLTFLALFPKYILKNPASDLKIIFLVLLFNAIFNVPSLELTTLFIASLFSLLFYRYKRV